MVIIARQFRDLGPNKEKKIDEAFLKSFRQYKGRRIPIVAFRSTLTNSGESLTDELVDEIICRNIEDADVNLPAVIETIKNTNYYERTSGPVSPYS
mmetsp:Transcript_28458/g.28787  ORF Transcript_28458/g.28787 Transcript_28458/m.28787 type:complete len:96 (-) Transcript_28458:307-594(-)